MHRATHALCAAAAATLLTATPAFAHESVSATATPSTIAPGGEIALKVTDCKGTTGAAKSSAFVADAELTGDNGKGTPLYGETTVKSSVGPGTYDITVTCDGHDHHKAGTFTVVHHEVQPTAPVRAGGGGAAERPVEGGAVTETAATEEGPGTRHALIGLALAAVAAVAVALRTVRRRRADLE
ncbi:hypothetical protein [Streptomyces sp. NPDC050504]|uniref:hypothetical protein n=1 Tax=Streptomyces sp. NPDC050504 TaxID=3365618 RepID=UPI0037AB5F06